VICLRETVDHDTLLLQGSVTSARSTGLCVKYERYPRPDDGGQGRRQERDKESAQHLDHGSIVVATASGRNPDTTGIATRRFHRWDT
jgi:hypothetical protein